MKGKLAPSETARYGHPTPMPTWQTIITAAAPPRIITLTSTHEDLYSPTRD